MCRVWSLVLLCLVSRAYLTVDRWTDDDFVSNLKKHGVAFVKFFAPWCGHCKRLAPTWEKLSESVGSVVPIVEVDCTESGQETCQDYKVSGYPSIQLIRYQGKGSARDNDVEQYNQARDIHALESFVRVSLLPAITPVDASNVSEFVVSSTEYIFLAVVKSMNSELLSALKDTVGVNKGFAKVGYMIRTGDEPVLDLPSDDVIAFFRPQALVGREDPGQTLEFKASNVEKFFIDSLIGKVYFRKPAFDRLVNKPMLTVFIDSDFSRDPSRFKMTRTKLYAAANEINDVTIAVASSSNYQEFLSELGKDTFKEEYLVTYYEDDEKKYVLSETITFKEANVLSSKVVGFIKDVRDGRVPVYFKSEAIPGESERKGPVYKLVGRTFDEVVNQGDKDVLIAFVASWCGHCKQLEPIYDSLGEKLKDEPNLLIARMDANENFVPKPYVVSGFPTIYFSPKSKRSEPKLYNGVRTVEAMMEWLKGQVTSPLRTIMDEL